MAATIAALSPIKLSSVSRGKRISGRGRAAALLWPSIKIQTASRRGFFAPSGGSRSKGESVILLRRHCGPSEGFMRFYFMRVLLWKLGNIQILSLCGFFGGENATIGRFFGGNFYVWNKSKFIILGIKKFPLHITISFL